MTGTSDFSKVERTSGTISGEGYPVIPAADLSMFKSQLRGTRLQKREELAFAVCSAVAKFDVDFYKDICVGKGWRDICSALRCGGSYFEKDAGHEFNKTLIK